MSCKTIWVYCISTKNILYLFMLYTTLKCLPRVTRLLSFWAQVVIYDMWLSDGEKGPQTTAHKHALTSGGMIGIRRL